MNSLQHVVHLAATDAQFGRALQQDTATALAQRGFNLSPEEVALLSGLRELLTLPANTVATVFSRVHANRPRWE